MEKKELLTIIGEKYNQISKIDDEIKTLTKSYADEHTLFKIDDIVTPIYTNNVILKCTGDFTYYINGDVIYVDCEIITSDTKKYKLGTILTIPENFLEK